MISIGFTRRNYVAENVVYGARHPDIAFRRVAHLPLHAVTHDPFWRAATAAWASDSVDLIHLYNDIGVVNRPFVVSFEDDFPRGRKRRRAWEAGVRLAASNRCRGLFAMSEHARRRFLADPIVGPRLGSKCVVVHPCVPRRDDAFARHLAFLADRRTGPASVELLFVGVQFFRKGGEFVLDALEPFARDPALALRLTVVSSFEPDAYATPFDAGDAARVRARIAASPWVRHVERAAPDAVRTLMADAHLLLFPTLDETFGFVAVEALATGLDVVASRVRALPEILPTGPIERSVAYAATDGLWDGLRLWRREGRPAFDRAYALARDAAVETIRARVRAVIDEPSCLVREAPALRAHYLARFTPEALGQRLDEAYRRVTR